MLQAGVCGRACLRLDPCMPPPRASGQLAESRGKFTPAGARSRGAGR
jgi:hypothetical protein